MNNKNESYPEWSHLILQEISLLREMLGLLMEDQEAQVHKDQILAKCQDFYKWLEEIHQKQESLLTLTGEQKTEWQIDHIDELNRQIAHHLSRYQRVGPSENMPRVQKKSVRKKLLTLEE